MPVDVVMPKLGLTMAGGTIARWIKQPGEAVHAGEPLVEVSTDKINYEVESPASGTVARALGSDGEEFACGDVIGVIALAGEMDVAVPANAAAPAANAAAADTTLVSAVVEAPRRPAAASDAGSMNGASMVRGSRTVASPAARRLARERGIPIGDVRGTGPRGRVTLSDIHAARDDAFAARAESSVVGPSVSKRALPPQLSASRRAIFRKMTEVAQLPLAQVATVARVDAVKALIECRRDFGWTAFAVYAVARLLREHAEIRTDATTGAPFAHIDVGVAADTPHGLVVPVVRGADILTLAAIHAEIVRLAGIARDGALTPSDVGGACFSISNVGPQRVERVSPLPDPPQTAILGIGAATQRPAVVDGTIVAAWMLDCSVSFDHRFIDGAPAARFLAAFANACTNPGVLL